MSDKKLLNESTIRRFMTLAAIQPLSNTFIKEQVPGRPGPPEEEAAVAGAEAEEAMPVDAEAELPPEEELAPEEPPEDGAAVSDEEADILIALGQRLSAEKKEAPPEDEEFDGEELGDEELAAVEEPVDAVPDEELEALGEILNSSNLEIFSERDERGLVNEVFKRVTKRIISERLR